MAIVHCHHMSNGKADCLAHVKAQTQSWRTAYQRVCPYIHGDELPQTTTAVTKTGKPTVPLTQSAGPASHNKAQCMDMVHRHKRWFDMEVLNDALLRGCGD